MGRTRRVSAAGAAAVMVAVGLAAAPAIADSPPQPGPVPISAVTQTRVTLTFTGDGCKGCVISPEQLIYASDNGGQEASWSGKDRKVRGDSVTFLVPTAALGSTSTAESAALAQVLSSNSWKLTAPLRKLTGK
jgi:hypothetical protein